MLNLLNDIGNSAFRIQSLRSRINELTEALHAEEMKIAAYAQQCIAIQNEELEKERHKRDGK